MRTHFLALGLLLSIGCKEAPKDQGMTKADLATIVCNCASPVVNLNAELQTLVNNKDMDALVQRMSAGEQLMTVAVDCVIDKIDEKAKSLLDDEFETVIADLCQLDQRMKADFIEKIENYNFPSY